MSARPDAGPAGLRLTVEEGHYTRQGGSVQREGGKGWWMNSCRLELVRRRSIWSQTALEHHAVSIEERVLGGQTLAPDQSGVE